MFGRLTLAGEFIGLVTNAASQVGLSHEEVQQRTLEARPQVAALLRELLAESPVP